jgi:hypothetical protein
MSSEYPAKQRQLTGLYHGHAGRLLLSKNGMLKYYSDEVFASKVLTRFYVVFFISCGKLYENSLQQIT